MQFTKELDRELWVDGREATSYLDMTKPSFKDYVYECFVCTHVCGSCVPVCCPHEPEERESSDLLGLELQLRGPMCMLRIEPWSYRSTAGAFNL